MCQYEFEGIIFHSLQLLPLAFSQKSYPHVSPATTANELCVLQDVHPDSKVHGTNMGPIWGRQDPSVPHVGPEDFVIWAMISLQR